MQQRDDVIMIFHPETAGLHTNLPEVNLASEVPFAFNDGGVFTQYVHAARCRLSAFPRSTSPASERVSALKV